MLGCGILSSEKYTMVPPIRSTSTKTRQHSLLAVVGTVLLVILATCCKAKGNNRNYKKSKQLYRRQIQGNVFLKDDVNNAVSGRQNACTLNENGFYGTIELSSDIYDIQYLYQVSVAVDTTEVQLRDDVILPLESVITTSILPTIFPECNRRRYRRSLQDTAGTITAISSTPNDTIIMTGLTCSKLVPNTNCYVIQGVNTVIATDFVDQDAVEALIQESVQSALQSNAIVSQLGSSLVVDVTSLTNDLEVAPPISTIPQAPVVTIPTSPSPPSTAPLPTGSSIPTTAVEPPVLTFAPIPGLPPTNPFFFGPSIPTILLPPSPSAMPTFLSLGPIASEAPSAVPIAAIPVTMNTPTPIPGNNDMGRDPQSTSENGGLKWWAWLLISLGGVAIVICGYGAYLNHSEGTTTGNTSGLGGTSSVGGGSGTGGSTIGMLSSNPTNKNSFKRKSSNFNDKKSSKQDDPHDTEDDDDVVPYEPPPGMDLYHPPAIATTTKSSSSFPDNNNGSLISFDTKNNNSTTPLIPTTTFFTNDATLVTPPPAFVNSALLHDDDEEEDEDEEEQRQGGDEEDDDEEEEEDDEEELQYHRDNEGHYMVEDEDDDEEYEEEEELEQGYVHHQQNHEDGEVFEDEESYYEEDEEDDDDEGGTFEDGQDHGFQQSPFGTMY